MRASPPVAQGFSPRIARVPGISHVRAAPLVTVAVTIRGPNLRHHRRQTDHAISQAHAWPRMRSPRRHSTSCCTALAIEPDGWWTRRSSMAQNEKVARNGRPPRAGSIGDDATRDLVRIASLVAVRALVARTPASSISAQCGKRFDAGRPLRRTKHRGQRRHGHQRHRTCQHQRI
jgi:hypothetical protein